MAEPKPRNECLERIDAHAVDFINDLFAAERTSRRPILMERAFEIARSGAARNIATIRKVLSEEGYMDVRAQLDGRFTQKQLADLIAAAR